MTRRKRAASLFVACFLAVGVFMPYGMKIWYVVGDKRPDVALPTPEGYCPIAWYDPRDIVVRWLGGMALFAGDGEVIGWYVGCGPEARGSLAKLGLDHYAIYIDGSREAMLANMPREELIMSFAARAESEELPTLGEAAERLAAQRHPLDLAVGGREGDVAGYFALLDIADYDEAAAAVTEVDLTLHGLTRLPDRPIMLMTALPGIPVAGPAEASLEDLVAELVEIQRDAMRRLVAAN